MSIKIKLNKKLFEGENQVPAAPANNAQPADSSANNASTDQPQNNMPDPNEVIKSLSTFLTGLFNNLKAGLAPDAIVKAVPAIKTAKEQKLPYSDAVKPLEDAVVAFGKVDTADIKNIKAAADAFNAILTNIASFTEAVQKSASDQSAQPAAPVAPAANNATPTTNNAASTTPAAPAANNAAPATNTPAQ